MKNVSRLITQVRRETENTDSNASGDIGITDAEFLQYFNDGQKHLQALIQHAHTRFFDTEVIIPIVGSVREYSLPADILYFHRVVKVEYSSTSNVLDYLTIPQRGFGAIASSTVSGICGFALSNNKLITHGSPSTSTGSLRVTYTQVLPDLDSSRGTVASTTDDGTDYTTIVLTAPDDDELALAEYVSIVDWSGAAQYDNIPVASYDSGTSTLTLRSGVALADGTITAGDTLCSGQFSTTHSQLPNICERYLIAYCSWKIFKRDSSTDSAEAFQELQFMEDDILKSLSRPSDSISRWNTTNRGYLL